MAIISLKKKTPAALLKETKNLHVGEVQVIQPDQIHDFLPKLNSTTLPFRVKREYDQGCLVLQRTA